MRGYCRKTVLAICLLAFFVSWALPQERQPLTLEKIEDALKEGALPQGRLATIVIRDQGIGFEVTEEVKARLKRAGAGFLSLIIRKKAS